jgi:hypothetical protein
MLACEVRLSACQFLRLTASHLTNCQQFWQQLLQGIHSPAPCRDRYCAVDRCPAGPPVQVLCCDHHVSPCSVTYSPTATTTKLSHLHSNHARARHTTQQHSTAIMQTQLTSQDKRREQASKVACMADSQPLPTTAKTQHRSSILPCRLRPCKVCAACQSPTACH